MSRLFIFGRLANDPQGILAAVYRLALVFVENRSNGSFGCLTLAVKVRRSWKLSIAGFTNA
jgi:hypothetical protein